MEEAKFVKEGVPQGKEMAEEPVHLVCLPKLEARICVWKETRSRPQLEEKGNNAR